MKRITISFTIGQLMAALLAVPLLLAAYSFVSPEGESISAETAHTYYTNYQSANPFSQINGYVVTKDMFNAMSQIGTSGAPGGFRFYYGKDDRSANVVMIVGLDAEGNDMAGNIRNGGTTLIGACPPVCDATSPIVSQ
jgi:hypothetical protein